MRKLAEVSLAAMALTSIAPRPLNQTGSGVRNYRKKTSIYMPHQGQREIARRQRQAAARATK